MMRGKLIAFEGCDGAGKCTQTKMLAAKLKALLIAFPRYDTPVGQEILANLKGEREYVNSWVGAQGRAREAASLSNALVRQSLFTFDRYLAANEIETTLAAGTHVIVDRYWLSGLVYGTCDGLDATMLGDVHRSLPQPDVWFLLDVDPAESIRRRPERRDQYERDGKAAQRRDLYENLFGLHQAMSPQPGRWRVIDGMQTVDDVRGEIELHLKRMFGSNFVK